MTTAILAFSLLLCAVALMGVRALFVKGGRFPSGHVHDIKALRDKGIGCSHGVNNKITENK